MARGVKRDYRVALWKIKQDYRDKALKDEARRKGIPVSRLIAQRLSQ